MLFLAEVVLLAWCSLLVIFPVARYFFTHNQPHHTSAVNVHSDSSINKWCHIVPGTGQVGQSDSQCVTSYQVTACQWRVWVVWWIMETCSESAEKSQNRVLRLSSSWILLQPLRVQRQLYSATSIDMKLVHWPFMGCLLHLVQWGGDWASSFLVAVPNVTAHSSTASVPIAGALRY